MAAQPDRIEWRLRALRTARDLAVLGARVRTIHLSTGLLPRDVLHLLFPDRQSVPRGRAPDSPEWFHSANLIARAEAAIVVSLYRQLRDAGVDTVPALLSAYRRYQAIGAPPWRISIDRAFDLVSHVDGIWVARTPCLALATCAHCACRHLVAHGSAAHSTERCPFCTIRQRYAVDARVRSAFPEREVPAWDEPQLPSAARRPAAWS